MQCPLAGLCLMSPKFVLLALGGLGVALGVFSIFLPKRSIELYQWIMAHLNWKVAPIDEAKEIRNTRILGIALAALSLIFFAVLPSGF